LVVFNEMITGKPGRNLFELTQLGEKKSRYIGNEIHSLFL